MVTKRPFGDEESYEGSSKHPRQLDYTNKLVSFLQFVRAEDTAQPSEVSGEALACFKEDDENAGGITEKYNKADASSPLLLTSEHHNSGWHVSAVVHCEKTHSSLLASLPQKPVPIGPDFQADIPEWSANNTCISSARSELISLLPQALESNLNDNNNVEDVGNGRTGCNCEDSGSVRCVRQHIQEARENLLRSIGQERFFELGFSDMGEAVAEKWSRAEELLFREVVFSNPVSSGYNFSDHLSMVFPYRSKRDIVSYYFNVFVLQKRSVQNRYDPTTIDSDDDEWLGIDGDGDSVFESEACYDANGENLKFCSGTVNNVIKRHFGSFDEYVLEHCETKVWDFARPKNEVEFLPTCSVIEEVFGLGSLNHMAGDGKGLS